MVIKAILFKATNFIIFYKNIRIFYKIINFCLTRFSCYIYKKGCFVTVSRMKISSVPVRSILIFLNIAWFRLRFVCSLRRRKTTGTKAFTKRGTQCSRTCGRGAASPRGASETAQQREPHG